MDKILFNRIINKVKSLLRENEKLLNNCISKEDKNGSYIDKKKIYEIIDSYKATSEFDAEKQKIGICYSGNYQITIHYILDSIIHENKIVLSNLLLDSFTSFIVNIFDLALKELKISSPVIKFNCSEQELFQEDKLTSIIYIGDSFNFTSFRTRYRGNAELKYDSFENIKLILNMDKKENREIYAKIFAFCYNQNINIERYDNIEELSEENLDTDYIVAYVDDEEKEKCLQLKHKKIMFNNFPFENYNFTIIK